MPCSSHLLGVERDPYPLQDIRGCVEQLLTVEKEVRALVKLQKELADLRDRLADKGIERNELKLRQEASWNSYAQAQAQFLIACRKTTLQCS